MTDVVNKLWDFCNYLRHEGMSYGTYIEQLTYLLFLKMAHETRINIPKNCTWNVLIGLSGSELLEKYTWILETLAEQDGLLGDIFTRSRSEFANPTNLKKLLNLINEINWTLLGVDVKGQAYEGLLEKFAEEEKGAGQYFTPRSLINVIIRCVKPDFRKSQDFQVHDPASGTCGFLIAACEWNKKITKGGSQLSSKNRIRLLKHTFTGMDNVVMTRRIGLMNCYLHSIEATIHYGDSLGDGPQMDQKYDVILTNPPFGSKGAGGAPTRDDFLVKTSNKQINFVQHAITILKNEGVGAMIIPDNVLFESSGKKFRKNLLKVCNLHTILRLPDGTFHPYANVRANVIFFTKGTPTEKIWIYDLRTNMPNINKGNLLTEIIFEDFEKCYTQKQRKPTKLFNKFTKNQIEDNDFILDFKFVDDHQISEIERLPEPEILVKEMAVNLKSALHSIDDLATNLEKK